MTLPLLDTLPLYKILAYFQMDLSLKSERVFVYSKEDYRFILHIPIGSGTKQLWSNSHFRILSKLELIQFLTHEIELHILTETIHKIVQHTPDYDDHVLIRPIEESVLFTYAFAVKKYDPQTFQSILTEQWLSPNLFYHESLVNRIYTAGQSIAFPLLSETQLVNMAYYNPNNRSVKYMTRNRGVFKGNQKGETLYFLHPKDLLEYYSYKNQPSSFPVFVGLESFHYFSSNEGPYKIQVGFDLISLEQTLGFVLEFFNQFQKEHHAILLDEPNSEHLRLIIDTPLKPSIVVNKLCNSLNHGILNRLMVNNQFIPGTEDLQSFRYVFTSVIRLTGHSYIEINLYKSSPLLFAFIKQLIAFFEILNENIAISDQTIGRQMIVKEIRNLQ